MSIATFKIVTCYLNDVVHPAFSSQRFQHMCYHGLSLCAVHGDERQIMEVKRILQDELPDENYVILKYVMQFLVEVSTQFDCGPIGTHYNCVLVNVLQSVCHSQF